MSKAYTEAAPAVPSVSTIADEPAFPNNCQCRDCQHMSGTGHGSYLTFKREGLACSGDATAAKRRPDLPAATKPDIFTVHAAGWMSRAGLTRNWSRTGFGATPGIGLIQRLAV
jgi:hypothetical protein